MRVDVHHHHRVKGTKRLRRTLDLILAEMTVQGALMSALSDAVDALQGRITEDVTHLLDLLAAANARAEAAAANDAADAATIAQLQADNAAAMADAQATVERLNAIDPVADFPGVEEPAPPAEG